MLDMYPDQKEITNPIDLIVSINHANTIAELNRLRDGVVAAKDSTILAAWQKKYWGYKKNK